MKKFLSRFLAIFTCLLFSANAFATRMVLRPYDGESESEWIRYEVEGAAEGLERLPNNQLGKWMCFLDEGFDRVRIAGICTRAVESGIVAKAECSRGLLRNGKIGIFFFLDCRDADGHKRIIKYLLDNKLIIKTGLSHIPYNTIFKSEDETVTIKVEEIIDLGTGKWEI